MSDIVEQLRERASTTHIEPPVLSTRRLMLEAAEVIKTLRIEAAAMRSAFYGRDDKLNALRRRIEEALTDE